MNNLNNTMRVKKAGKNLFLLEIIIVMLFFSLSSAIIVQLFANAYTQSRDGRCLVKAVTAASNYAEVFKSEHGDVKRTEQLIGYDENKSFGKNWIWNNDENYTRDDMDTVFAYYLQLFYDRDFNPVKGETNAVYTMTAVRRFGQPQDVIDLAASDPDVAEGLRYCTVTVKKGNDVIFEIQVAA